MQERVLILSEGKVTYFFLLPMEVPLYIVVDRTECKKWQKMCKLHIFCLLYNSYYTQNICDVLYNINITSFTTLTTENIRDVLNWCKSGFDGLMYVSIDDV